MDAGERSKNPIFPAKEDIL